MKRSRFPVVSLSDPLSAWPADRRAVLLVPGEEAVVLEFDMPAGVGRGVADRITHHSVQDLVSEEMGELHLVRLPADRSTPSNRRQAIVTRRVHMSAWHERAVRAGARLAAMLPDYLALPWESDTWTVRVESGRIQARFGRLDGFAAETDLGVAILERRWREASVAPERIRLLVEPVPAEDPSARLLSWLDETGVPVNRETPPTGAPQLRHGELDGNLLAGTFSESLAIMQELARWRGPLGIAAAALLAWALDTGLVLHDQRAEIEVLDRRIEAMFRSELVPSGPILDLRTQVARSVEALRAQYAAPREANTFLALLAASDETLAQHTRRISRLSYRDGVLTAEVTLADFRSLEALDAELAKRRLIVEVESSTASGGEGVEAMFNLRAAGGA